MILLVTLTGVCALLFSVLVLPGLIAAAKDLVKDEIVEGLPRLSELLLRTAANRYPTPHRERFAEEFQANLDHDFSSRRLSGLAYALVTYSVAPRRARALVVLDAPPPAVSSAEAKLTKEALSSLARQGATIGVFGALGSGKSSVLAAMRHALSNTCGVVDFNAWSADEGNAHAALLARVHHDLRKQGYLRRLGFWRLPGLTTALRSPGGRLRRLIRAATAERIVITVDDLDRCEIQRANDVLDAVADACAAVATTAKQIPRSHDRSRPAVTCVVAADGPLRMGDRSGQGGDLDRRLLALRFDAIYMSSSFSIDGTGPEPPPGT